MMRLAHFYRFSYGCLILGTCALLSGTFLGVPYKYGLSGLVLLVLMLYFLNTGYPFKKRYLVVTLSLASLLAWGTFVGYLNSFGDVVLEELIALSAPLIIILFYRRELMSSGTFLKLSLWGISIYALLKTVAAVLIGLGVWSLPFVQSLVATLFSDRFISSRGPILGDLMRIYTANDLLIALTPFLLFGHYRLRLPRLMQFSLGALFSFAIFISYSRFIMAFFVFNLVLALTPDFSSQLSKKRLFLGFCVSVSLIAAIGLNMKPISNQLAPIIARYNPNVSTNQDSDSSRRIQANDMFAYINQRPLIGWGIGSYIEANIRHRVKLFSYELQLLSFVFKFGLPIFFGIALIVVYYIKQTSQLSLRTALAFGALFSCGLTNPYLTSSVFGVAFLILLLGFSTPCSLGKTTSRYVLLPLLEQKLVGHQ